MSMKGNLVILATNLGPSYAPREQPGDSLSANIHKLIRYMAIEESEYLRAARG